MRSNFVDGDNTLLFRRHFARQGDLGCVNGRTRRARIVSTHRQPSDVRRSFFAEGIAETLDESTPRSTGDERLFVKREQWGA
jgi:hypothetical protein